MFYSNYSYINLQSDPYRKKRDQIKHEYKLRIFLHLINLKLRITPSGAKFVSKKANGGTMTKKVNGGTMTLIGFDFIGWAY